MKKNLIVVLGGGESGVGAALLSKKMGFKPFVSDSGVILNKYKKILVENGISFEEKGHTENIIIQKSIKVIKSPGISREDPLIKKINYLGIPIVSELEFGKNYRNTSYIISITGSNGKTTTSHIVYKILKKEGIHVGIAGNIGRSFSREVLNKKKDVYVLEVSSFQLDDCFKFRSNIAVLLNITRDHLNRYNNSFEKYIFSKFRIATHQNKEDIFIYNHDDPIIRKEFKKYPIVSNCIPFSIKEKLHVGAYIKWNHIFFRNKNQEEIGILNVEKIPLKGDHNLSNVMAAVLVSSTLNVQKKSIISTILELTPIEHRMEKVLNINGVQFINDSKATNVNSVFYALKSMNAPTIWIAGGQDKGNDYEELLPLVKEKVKAIIFLGKENKKFVNFFQDVIDIMVETESLRQAVRIAYLLSIHGDNILLSPACSSFNLFKDYKERGHKFKQEVRKLFYEKNRYFFE
ncbi:MAG: UDP-N-acetylmuramoyl-L-alanine--D-glutamate ligase [Flavobacteriales bacterium]|jgi:UDP-N-acetylmuramoylalanine--D-glutamate ligase|uniref:UDP-N-acetylmuramoyl-L-alanine--D-glutamate ligase n=1 Tax=Blattabacterium sp. (Mastotermes darwiniensis) TaxID=39768 RepID=UPI000231DF9D|nr:UDP-N-acetylmuramoyl-L-alanine--D-glutamate ligase [Blattabacterium sp. (Mastotermes darwiniensis)]AER40437.1 putative UDP-N-acetylmuramoylalanine--D-glutamate ligase [Blattabacterium sp. (Mastotermes darwiniensis) str. MADAR]MDR1804841.1 UDP-N-acetylmuramoyl-L-alanine--D-glutamate ligase [Flavobacteriales bacterium]